MFDVKYDRNGNVISEAPVPEQQEQPEETPQEQDSLEETLNQEPTTPDESPSGTYPSEQQAPTHKPSPSESFRELRAKMERLERERDELAALVTQKNQPQQAEPEDEDIHLGENDLAEGKHLSKVQKKIRKLEAQLRQVEERSSLTSTEAKLKAQFPDFESVVNRDTVAALREAEPELAQTLNSSNDIYAKAVSAYKMIKKLGLYQEDTYGEDKARVAKNTSKPRPVSSIAPQSSESPLARANAFDRELTPELQKKFHQEMLSAMRNR